MSIKKRNFGLDIVRAVAILLVMFSHLGFGPEHVGGLLLGNLGVEIFFTLSGFLIGGILINDFSSRGVNFPVISNFWVRRWLRTLPAYYLVVIAKFIFIDHSLGIKVLVYFFFLQNNFVGVELLGVSWSLVIEEWFYLILPIICLLLFHNRKFNLKRFLVFTIFFIVFENLIRLGWVLKANRTFAGINANFPFRLDSLMWGVLFATLKHNYEQIYKWFARGSVFILVMLVYLVMLWYLGKVNLVPGNIDKLVWARTIRFTINNAFVAMLIPYLEFNFPGKENPNFLMRIVTFISLVSYSVYLIHLDLYSYILRASIFTSDWYLQSLICVSLSLAIAALMYRYIEKPMMDLREHIKIRPKGVPIKE